MKRSRECEAHQEEAGEVGYLTSSWKKLRKAFFGGRESKTSASLSTASDSTSQTGLFVRTWSALFGTKASAQEAAVSVQEEQEELTAPAEEVEVAKTVGKEEDPAKEVEVDKTTDIEQKVEEKILDSDSTDEACPVIAKSSKAAKEAASTPTDEDEKAEGISELSFEVDELEMQAEKPCPDGDTNVTITLSGQALPMQCSVEDMQPLPNLGIAF